MKLPVKLSDLMDALELPEEWEAWLDLATGRLVILDPESRAGGEGEEGELIPGDCVEDPAVVQAIARHDPRYLALPTRFGFHEYRHMERFVGGLADANVAGQLWDALKGKGAFRRFKDTAHRLGVIEDWYDYRERSIDELVMSWAEANGITVDRSPRAP